VSKSNMGEGGTKGSNTSENKWYKKMHISTLKF